MAMTATSWFVAVIAVAVVVNFVAVMVCGRHCRTPACRHRLWECEIIIIITLMRMRNVYY